MKPEAILEILRKASLFDIFLVSFLLLPFIANQWVDVLQKLEWSKPWGLAVMLIGYVVGIVLMLVGADRSKRRETARDEIVAYLTAKDFTLMSHERIRKNINAAYDDSFLGALPTCFPNVLRRAKMKDGRPGLARIIPEEIESEG